MIKRRFLRYGQIWTEFLRPCFREEPSVPSKEALAYHALFSAASDRSARKVRVLAKGSFRKFASDKVEELYESWSRTEGELGYGVKEAVDIALKVIEEAWVKAFPSSGLPATRDVEVELKRKFLAVDLQLAERLRRAAIEGGVKLKGMVDDALEQKLAAARLGVTLRQTLDFYDAVKLCSSYGLCLMPMEPFNRIVGNLKPEDIKALTEDYRSSGAMLGVYLRTRGEDEALKLFRRIFETGIFRVTSLDLSRKEKLLEVKCIAPTLTGENTKLLTALLEGIVEGIGFTAIKRECMRGIILLTAKLQEAE